MLERFCQLGRNAAWPAAEDPGRPRGHGRPRPRRDPSSASHDAANGVPGRWPGTLKRSRDCVGHLPTRRSHRSPFCLGVNIEKMKTNLEPLRSGGRLASGSGCVRRSQVSLCAKWAPYPYHGYDRRTLLAELIARELFPRSLEESRTARRGWGGPAYNTLRTTWNALKHVQNY